VVVLPWCTAGPMRWLRSHAERQRSAAKSVVLTAESVGNPDVTSSSVYQVHAGFQASIPGTIRTALTWSAR